MGKHAQYRRMVGNTGKTTGKATRLPWRQVAVLSAAQATFLTTVNINIIITSLVGAIIAPKIWLATMPLSLMFIASMVSTLPASLLMGRFGRKPVFLAGSIIGIGACLGLGFATVTRDFPLFMLMSAGLGVMHSIAQFYRYAAADDMPADNQALAVSLVLAGSILAAIFGATLARFSFTLIDGHLYAGCFLMAAGVQALALLILLLLANKPPPAAKASNKATRPLLFFARQPRFAAGLISASFGYAVMSFVMTATPLQIVHSEHMSDASNAIIIQWHVLAMFAPSLVTGWIIKRFGVLRVLWAGVGFYILVWSATFAGTSFWHYFAALFFLGLGWNMLFVGGSTIIAQATQPHERAKVQGVADLLITGMVAAASLLAASLHYLLGWKLMMIASMPVVAMIAISILIAMRAAAADSRPAPSA